MLPKGNLHYPSMFVQMATEFLTVWYPLVCITLSGLLMFTYLKSWGLGPAFIRAGKIQFFDT